MAGLRTSPLELSLGSFSQLLCIYTPHSTLPFYLGACRNVFNLPDTFYLWRLDAALKRPMRPGASSCSACLRQMRFGPYLHTHPSQQHLNWFQWKSRNCIILETKISSIAQSFAYHISLSELFQLSSFSLICRCELSDTFVYSQHSDVLWVEILYPCIFFGLIFL